MEIAASASCISALLSGWIAKSGIPENITSDRVTTFTFQFWTSLASLLGVTLHQITTYNPAADGKIERFHRAIKAALMSCCKDSNLFTRLLWVLLGLRITPKDALNVLAAEMVYGDLLVVSGKFFYVCNLLRQSPVPTARQGKIFSMLSDLKDPS
ncbi:uncharacterized protein [Palaemon carinicauda]|uniref:uncharacterized protein n=1 Tax=Palaemon carinicauda TaxID=392227 RepID=UPI0035B63A9E